MIVRNWMQANPAVLGSDTLLSEAKRILSETNLHALPVVDEGRLRGLVTRAGCLRAAHAAIRSQSPDELNYFSNHVKVKDVMVRNPATIDANDTMERCLQVGQQAGVGQLPVMDGDHVVGMISAIEMFSLAAHFLGAWEKRSGVTLAPTRIGPGTIGRIADIVEGTGAEVHAIYPISLGPKGVASGDQERKVIVRFHHAATADVVQALGAAGYEVIESVQAIH
ncbi:MAG TPA: CBS domain-containing protein [Aromatoleum sp.]|uniref:CBS domain-containing protein n=1 Tax=Aromatoleum sp. TaxID=2307007 RepID=UPI002B468659|nr:CBS domain-containing protein [Aromatoleum sp.]HJV24847.1 CBS domain-containing protein [Aromatoleum sp.]